MKTESSQEKLAGLTRLFCFAKKKKTPLERLAFDHVLNDSAAINMRFKKLTHAVKAVRADYTKTLLTIAANYRIGRTWNSPFAFDRPPTPTNLLVHRKRQTFV